MTFSWDLLILAVLQSLFWFTFGSFVGAFCGKLLLSDACDRHVSQVIETES